MDCHELPYGHNAFEEPLELLHQVETLTPGHVSHLRLLGSCASSTTFLSMSDKPCLTYGIILPA
jgi:hypothetical protein